MPQQIKEKQKVILPLNDDKKIARVVYIFGIIPVIWLALLIAPYSNGGLMEIIKNSNNILNNPFNIIFTQSSIKTILIFLLIYNEFVDELWIPCGLEIFCQNN